MDRPVATSTTFGDRNTRALALGAALLLVSVLVAHFLWGNYLRYGRFDPATYGLFWPRRGLLWMHLAGGSLGMVLGALQFVAPLRRGYPRIHRWTGRAYLLAMLCACVAAAALTATMPAGPAVRIAFAATGIAWLCTALPGFIAIRNGQVQAHQRWMTRAYIVTFAPVLVRLGVASPTVMMLATPDVMVPLVIWMSWALPLLVYESAAALVRAAKSRQAPHRMHPSRSP